MGVKVSHVHRTKNRKEKKKNNLKAIWQKLLMLTEHTPIHSPGESSLLQYGAAHYSVPEACHPFLRFLSTL